MKKNKNISGFSLVELSVVLVVAGLTMAAITSGAHLLQAAKLNKTISEITGYVTAVNNFKDKHKAWPGDMTNATSYWGTYHVTNNPNGVVNGNGDEQIAGAFQGEPLYAWQEMALSGLIPGKYTGQDAGTPDFVAGVNLPGSSIAGSYFMLYYYPTFGTTGNYLQLGSQQSNTQPNASVLSPSDTHVIDIKIDDGLATTGNFIGFRGDEFFGVAGKCVTSDHNTASANYILTDNTVSCRLGYWINKI